MTQYLDKYVLYRRTLFAIFWVWATFGFLQDEFFPFLAGFRSVIYFLLDIILVLLGCFCFQRNNSKWIIFFITYIVIDTIFINGLSIINCVNGLRSFIPFIIIPSILYYFLKGRNAEDFINKMDKHLYILLLLQAPCLIFQFLKYGANDHGGGTFGNWGSGLATMTIYLVSFYLISKRWNRNNYFKSLLENKQYILLLIPSFLNETKVGFILFGLYFLLLIKFDRQVLFKLLLAIPLLSIGFFILYKVYMTSTESSMEITSIGFYQEYLYQEDTEDLMMMAEMLADGDFEDDEWSIDLARFTKISLMSTAIEYSGGNILTGLGVSHFKGGTTLAQTEVAKNLPWAFTGTIPYLYFVVMQLGLLGLAILVAILVSLFKNFREVKVRDCYIQFYAIVAFCVICCYNDILAVPVFGIIFFYIIISSSNKLTKEIADKC